MSQILVLGKVYSFQVSGISNCHLTTLHSNLRYQHHLKWSCHYDTMKDYDAAFLWLICHWCVKSNVPPVNRSIMAISSIVCCRPAIMEVFQFAARFNALTNTLTILECLVMQHDVPHQASSLTLSLRFRVLIFFCFD